MADHRPVEMKRKDGTWIVAVSTVLPAEPTKDCHGECGFRHFLSTRHQACCYARTSGKEASHADKRN